LGTPDPEQEDQGCQHEEKSSGHSLHPREELKMMSTFHSGNSGAG